MSIRRPASAVPFFQTKIAATQATLTTIRKPRSPASATSHSLVALTLPGNSGLSCALRVFQLSQPAQNAPMPTGAAMLAVSDRI